MSDGSHPWWQSAVVYQVYPRSFADGNGDGIGDLAGVIGRLDYLVDLGVDVIWLSPVYPSPQADNGYDVSDYQAIDPVFGTLEDFDELVARAHAHGIRLVLDLVVNHTSQEHPWFLDSRSSRDSPRRDWYWWGGAREGFEPGSPGAEPTNWGSFFSGSVWELDPGTEEYYLHLFGKEQPDLNWENPEVRRAVYAVMRWWLDRGVDGFRMDVINMVSKVLPLTDGRVRPGAVYGDGFPHFICGPRIHEFMAEMRREVLDGHDKVLLTVGEMPGVTVEEAVLFTDPQRRELDMVFQFEHVSLDAGDSKWELRPLDLRELKATMARWQTGLARTGWNSLYWSNHDQPRAVSRFGDDGAFRVRSAKMLATVLHLHRGTPYIYQGEELGMTNAPFSGIEDFRDIETINHYRAQVAAGADHEAVLDSLRVMSRDNARTPMQWDAGQNAGFTKGAPWMAVNPNHVEVNAAAQMADPESVWHHYRRLIALRHSLPVVSHGDFTILLADHPSIYAFTRRFEGDELLVLANFSSTATLVDLPDIDSWSGGQLLLGNLEPGEAEAEPNMLAPWEARVLYRPSTG